MTSYITTPCLPQVETEATAELFDCLISESFRPGQIMFQNVMHDL